MKNLRTAAPSRHAFTLLEMMVVLLIIALILGSVAVMVQGIEGNAQQVTTDGKIKALETALTAYANDPSDTSLAQSVVSAAQSVASTLNSASDTVTTVRTRPAPSIHAASSRSRGTVSK